MRSHIEHKASISFPIFGRRKKRKVPEQRKNSRFGD